MSETPMVGETDSAGTLLRGRTPPLDPAEADRIFRRGVAHFNGARYWHAHEDWETLWRAAPDDDRDFYQGLIQVAAALLHLQRRNRRGARNKLAEGLDRLRPYQPAHRDVFVNELVGKASRTLEDLEAGYMPYLIPPVLRFVDADSDDFSR
jgi:uncharacterized protein